METQENNSSQGASVSQSRTSCTPGKPKTFVDIDLAGVPIGDNASRFSTRAGDFIRIHIPVNKKDWRLVPIERKDDLWNALMVSISTLAMCF